MIDVSSSKPLLAVAGICTWTAVLISIHQVRKDWLAVPKEEDRKQGGGENETGKTLEKCVDGFPFSVSVRREQALKTLLRPPPLQQQQKKTCRSSSTSGTTRNRSSSAISSASSSWSPSTPSRASSRCCSRSRPLTSTPSATATRCVFFVLLLSFALSSLLSRF